MRSRKLPLGAVLALLAGALAGPATAKEASGAEAELLATEQRRYQAMVDAQVAALGGMLAEELRFTHANGVRETREALLASLASGRLDYLSVRTRDDVARVYGDTGVVTGAADLEVRAAGGPELELRILFTAVYVAQDGAWRLVAYQSTRAPEGGAR